MPAFSRVFLVSIVCLLSTVLPAQNHARAKKSAAKKSQAAASTAKPSAADAQKFIDDSEKQLSDLADKGQRADWVNENFITDDTDALATDANSEQSSVTTKLALDAKRFDAVTLAPTYERKLHLLKLQLTLPTPSDPALLHE